MKQSEKKKIAKNVAKDGDVPIDNKQERDTIALASGKSTPA